jgi:hypothetical protein
VWPPTHFGAAPRAALPLRRLTSDLPGLRRQAP